MGRGGMSPTYSWFLVVLIWSAGKEARGKGRTQWVAKRDVVCLHREDFSSKSNVIFYLVMPQIQLLEDEHPVIGLEIMHSSLSSLVTNSSMNATNLSEQSVSRHHFALHRLICLSDHLPHPGWPCSLQHKGGGAKANSTTFGTSFLSRKLMAFLLTGGWFLDCLCYSSSGLTGWIWWIHNCKMHLQIGVVDLHIY